MCSFPMVGRGAAEPGARRRPALPLALRYGVAALVAAALTLVLLQLLLGRRLAQTREEALGAQLASSVLLGEVGLERFSPEGLAALAGMRLAVGPAPERQGAGPWRPADAELQRQRQALRRQLCRRLGRCPELRPAGRGPRGVWVAMESPLEQVWLFAPLPALAGWPPDPLQLALALGSGGLTALLLFLSLEVQRPLQRLEQGLAGVGLEPRPAAVPPGGTGSVRRLARRFNTMLKRLEAIERERRTMLAGISHDLRAPLTRLRLRLDAAPLAAAVRGGAEADLAALERITTQVLLFAGADGEEVPVSVPLEALLAELAAVADAGTLVLALQPLQRRVRPVALARAIANLLDNALAHGRPPIRLTLEPGPGRDGFTIEVSDAGPGIPPERWALALEPFQRLDRSRGGAGHCGLGLAIAERVARQHAGRLSAGFAGAPPRFTVRFEARGLAVQSHPVTGSERPVGVQTDLLPTMDPFP